MAIKSSAFGRVALTDVDAEKFIKQIRYGRPKATARDAVKRGVAMAKELQREGTVKITSKRANGSN